MVNKFFAEAVEILDSGGVLLLRPDQEGGPVSTDASLSQAGWDRNQSVTLAITASWLARDVKL